MTLRKAAIVFTTMLAGCTGRAADPPPSDTMGHIDQTPPAPVRKTQLPCDVLKVFQDHCWACHGDQLQYGAPMHLQFWEDLQGKDRNDQQPYFQHVEERIHDAGNPMPPRSYTDVPRPNATELATLDSWIAQGAPPRSAADQCTSVPPPPTGAGGAMNNGSGGAGGDSNPWAAGGASPLGSGGEGPLGAGGVPDAPPGTTTDAGSGPPPFDDTPYVPDPSECTNVSIHARNDASGAPFQVPAFTEQYYCMSFHVNLNGPTQAFAFKKHIDNTSVLHHWLLYKMATPQTDGKWTSCVGLHPDGLLMAGWAPGGQDWYLPKDVGMDMGTGDFMLEVHYNNVNGPAATDTSGVDICTSTNRRPNQAGIYWIGTWTLNIPPGGTTNITTHCAPQLTQPFYVLRSWPHMHKLGRNMNVKIHRSSGATETLIDQPFDFNSQIQYSTPAVLNPGDTLETTCSFDNNTPNFVVFGESTSEEMCYNFTVGYPDTANFPGGNIPAGCGTP
jgi:hypothetical protein